MNLTLPIIDSFFLSCDVLLFFKALKTPPAFAEQRKSLERAKVRRVEQLSKTFMYSLILHDTTESNFQCLPN